MFQYASSTCQYGDVHYASSTNPQPPQGQGEAFTEYPIGYATSTCDYYFSVPVDLSIGSSTGLTINSRDLYLTNGILFVIASLLLLDLIRRIFTMK